MKPDIIIKIGRFEITPNEARQLKESLDYLFKEEDLKTPIEHPYFTEGGERT